MTQKQAFEAMANGKILVVNTSDLIALEHSRLATSYYQSAGSGLWCCWMFPANKPTDLQKCGLNASMLQCYSSKQGKRIKLTDAKQTH